MESRISEIADGLYRLSTYVPGIAPPAGLRTSVQTDASAGASFPLPATSR